MSFLPRLRVEYKPFHHPDIPLILELHLDKTRFNIETEHLEGFIKFKEVNQMTMDTVKKVQLDIVH